MNTILFVIQLVYTNGILQSVYTDEITDKISRIKKRRFADMKLFVGDFTDRITEGFKPGFPYSDVTNSPSELSMESPTE